MAFKLKQTLENLEVLSDERSVRAKIFKESGRKELGVIWNEESRSGGLVVEKVDLEKWNTEKREESGRQQTGVPKDADGGFHAWTKVLITYDFTITS